MNHDNMYPVCTILYKTENTDGWYYAIMSGSEKECKKECNKLKKINNWYDYKCYISSWCAVKRDIPFQNIMPEAEYIHHLTGLIYNPFNNKFYYSEETMPYPETKKRTVSKFEIIVKGEGENDKYISEPWDIDDFECGTDITMSFGSKKDKIITIAEDLVKDVPDFIKRLQKIGYANLSIEEYTYTKFLAWEVEDRVRFIVHYYGDDNIETEFDKLIPKELFYNEFEKFLPKLKKCIKKHNKLFEEFKQQEQFLQGLKWVFDENSVDKPVEFTCVDWDETKAEKFKIFVKTINTKSDEHTINWDTREKLFCYLANEYYYWINDNKIYRKFFYSCKDKDVIRFLKSNDFNYKQEMSLTDIYNQLLDKGYNNVISCKYNGKEVEIYENGQVESQEATKDETKELEQLIIKLTKNIKDKENITVSNLVHVLKDNIESISFRDGNMKL